MLGLNPRFRSTLVETLEPLMPERPNHPRSVARCASRNKPHNAHSRRLYFERTMKYAQNVNVAIEANLISNAVVPVQENANFILRAFVTVPYGRKRF